MAVCTWYAQSIVVARLVWAGASGVIPGTLFSASVLSTEGGQTDGTVDGVLPLGVFLQGRQGRAGQEGGKDGAETRLYLLLFILAAGGGLWLALSLDLSLFSNI